jgi:translation initiation factor IF-2
LGKIRIYALAKELGLDSKRVLDALEGLGVQVRSHASSIDDSVAATVRELLAEETAVEQAAAKAAAEAAAAEAARTAAAAAPPPRPTIQQAKVRPRAATGERPPGAVPVPPVVTVMGHVDHGKTTLLDTIRQTQVTAQEFGGITQHIGASEIIHNDRRIVFLDTPGHEAFTAMRARGAQVTDIAVLVVAADDGVMPQTLEAIDHARAANVPIIVAINKVDLPDANVDRVKQQLADRGLVPEDWGGDTIMVPVSALRGDGIPDLLEMILLVADVQELWADPVGSLAGSVVEARMDISRGTVATLLIRDGTLRVGDALICGLAPGRVRSMHDPRAQPVKEAGPGTAVEITGLEGMPDAGDAVESCVDLRTARAVAEERQQALRLSELEQHARVSLETLFADVQAQEVKELNLILKGDVWGSVEALQQSLEALNAHYKEIAIKFVHTGVGTITESDIGLAVASNAVVIGFHVEAEGAAARMVEQEGVDVRAYRVIYDAIDDIQKAMLGMLEPVYEEYVVGRAEVLQLFHSSRAGQIAGCRVTEGRAVRGSMVRITRDGEEVHRGTLDSLRHLKETVNQVEAPRECGIALGDFNDWQVGDLVEMRSLREVPRQAAVKVTPPAAATARPGG